MRATRQKEEMLKRILDEVLAARNPFECLDFVEQLVDRYKE